MKKTSLILGLIFLVNFLYAFRFGTVNLGKEAGKRAIEESANKVGWGEGGEEEYRKRDPRLVFVTDPAVEGWCYWSSVAISSDTIYYGTSGIDGYPEGADYTNALYAFDKNTGKIKWKFTIDEDEVVKGAIVIGPDGTIYFITVDMPWYASDEGSTYLYAINPDGTEKWKKKKISDVKPHFWGQESPAVDEDGTIYYYVCVDTTSGWKNALIALDSNGNEKWRYFPIPHTEKTVWPAPTISGNTIYVQSTDYLYAIHRLTGGLIWQTSVQGAGNSLASPIVGSDGTIYASQGRFLVAYSSTGSVKWLFDAKATIFAQPVIGPDGTIYVVTSAKEKVDPNKIAGYCWAVDPSTGGAKWMFDIDKWMYDEHDKTSKESDNYGPAVVGKDGTIYFTTEYRYLWALNPDGTLKEIYDIDSLGSTEDKGKYPIYGTVTYSALTIDENGILYRPTSNEMNGKEYMVIIGIQTESPGLADSPWPKGYKNNKNTNFSP